uniref:Uncharacterized protein n=1 Tax=Anguilla anguilla TaxID=7936 RepID=A0A0E9T207_ANGAN
MTQKCSRFNNTPDEDGLPFLLGKRRLLHTSSAFCVRLSYSEGQCVTTSCTHSMRTY